MGVMNSSHKSKIVFFCLFISFVLQKETNQRNALLSLLGYSLRFPPELLTFRVILRLHASLTQTSTSRKVPNVQFAPLALAKRRRIWLITTTFRGTKVYSPFLWSKKINKKGCFSAAFSSYYRFKLVYHQTQRLHFVCNLYLNKINSRF